MTDTATAPVVTDRPVSDDELFHIVCCRNADVSVCGLNVQDLPWEGDGPDCVVCTDLWELEQCPMFDACKGCTCGECQ